MLKLTSFHLYGKTTIAPAPLKRAWLDRLPQKFGYRCLPLTMGNQLGWEINCSHHVTATLTESGIEIDVDDDKQQLVDNHFGGNILSFYPGFLFRTPPGWDLLITGPSNRPKHGISPLTALIESDWASYSFSMNWVMTEVGTQVTFAQGEAFCQIVPIQRGLNSQFEAQICDLDSDLKTKSEYEAWSKSRKSTLNADVITWDKKYHQGLTPLGETNVADHQRSLSLSEFIDRRQGEDPELDNQSDTPT